MNTNVSNTLPSPHRRLPNWFKWEYLIIIAIVALFGIPEIAYPFGRDQGIHAYTGAAWLDGRLPYRDIWVQKGPLAFLPHTLVTAVFGRTMWGIRVFDLIWQLLINLLLFHIARRRLTTWASLLTITLYSLVYFAFGFWNTAHLEGHLLPLVLAAILLYEKPPGPQQHRWRFWSGGLIALTFWFKQTAVVHIAGLSAWLLLDGLWTVKQGQGIKQSNPLPRLWQTLWPHSRSFVIGGLAATLLVLAYMTFTGMLRPMLDIYDYSFIDYPSFGFTNDPRELRKAFAAWVTRYAVIAFPTLLGIIAILLQPKQYKQWLGILLMTLSALAGVYAQKRFWDYHWISSLPFMALCSAYFVESIWRLFTKQHGFIRLLPITAVTITLLWLAAPLQPYYREMYRRLPLYFQDYPTYLSLYNLNETVDLATYLHNNTPPDAPIFIWGHYALINYLSDRANPTPFAFDPPLSLPNRHQETWRQQTINDLQKKPPAYLLVATDDASAIEARPSDKQLADFPALTQYIADNYALEQKFGQFDLYRVPYEPQQPLDIALGDHFLLQGYDLREANVTANGQVIITLHWTAVSPPPIDYSVFVHFVDWSIPAAIVQSDRYPAYGSQPTSQWRLGQTILDTHELALPADLPPGTYNLIVGMYNLNTLQRLTFPATNQDFLEIGQFSLN